MLSTPTKNNSTVALVQAKDTVGNANDVSPTSLASPGRARVSARARGGIGIGCGAAAPMALFSGKRPRTRPSAAELTGAAENSEDDNYSDVEVGPFKSIFTWVFSCHRLFFDIHPLLVCHRVFFLSIRIAGVGSPRAPPPRDRTGDSFLARMKEVKPNVKHVTVTAFNVGSQGSTHALTSIEGDTFPANKLTPFRSMRFMYKDKYDLPRHRVGEFVVNKYTYA
jgi:hypothetical protein